MSNNNAIVPTLAAGELTMSSHEVAALVEKRHDNVKRTIDTLVDRGVIAVPQIEETPTAGGGKPTTVYRLQKRDTFVVVAQLSPEFTARLVDRWQQLEEQVRQPPMPDTAHLYSRSDDARAAIVALDKAKRDALYAIELIADGLRQTTGASIKDAQHLIDHASDGLDDMLDGIRLGYQDIIDVADGEIERIEHHDLMLSRPVVL